MSMQKDMFLYLNMNDRLFGLNLREFMERHSSKPEFEVVQTLNPPTGRGRSFGRKDCMTMFNSNLYMMTETWRLRGDERLDLNVYSFDPTNSKSIRLCDKSASPRLIDENRPVLFTLKEKIYVLGEPSYSYRRRKKGVEEPQLFWVFDPFHEFWKQLPDPPFYDGDTRSVNYCVSYGHKLFVDTYYKRYVFDAHQERWEKNSESRHGWYDKPGFGYSAVVEYDDSFLIAVPQQGEGLELVAYKLDVKGFPQKHQVLHELNGMFPYRPSLNNPRALLGKCDDDNLMWLVYSGKDNVQRCTCIGVAVFRVSMSYDHAGKEVFSVDIEAADFIDHEVQGAEEVYSASVICHDNLKTNCKDWFLYLNVGDRLCRLNISEFCKWRSSFMSKTFELVRDYHPEGCPATIPSRMKHITVGSKVYMVGGQRLDGRIHSDAQGRYFAMPNLVIYALTYNYETDEGHSCITLCQCEGNAIPRLIDPRTKTIPITITFDDKIYVLAKRPYLGDAEELNDHDMPPLFKVFDPLKQSWKLLPHPPCYDISSRDNEPYVCNYFSLGNKLIIRTEAKKKKNRGTYIFDTQHERWEDAKNMSAILDEGFRVVAEFKGFLIGMPYERQELVAYHLGSDGIPTLSNVLHELQGIFSSCSLVSDCYLGKYDDDRMWLVYSAQDSTKSWHARVAVFRVFISNDIVGTEVLCADLEAVDFVQFDRCITSAFTYAP